MWPFRRPRDLGEQGEDQAVRHLRRAGYKILGRNVRLNRCEVDVIARKGDTTAFVEVKTRRRSDLVDPIENVTAEKRRNIRRVAEGYIRRYGKSGDYYRFDVITIVWPEGGKPEVTWYEDAFRDE